MKTSVAVSGQVATSTLFSTCPFFGVMLSAHDDLTLRGVVKPSLENWNVGLLVPNPLTYNTGFVITSPTDYWLLVPVCPG
jgi:hypothetical protein